MIGNLGVFKHLANNVVFDVERHALSIMKFDETDKDWSKGTPGDVCLMSRPGNQYDEELTSYGKVLAYLTFDPTNKDVKSLSLTLGDDNGNSVKHLEKGMGIKGNVYKSINYGYLFNRVETVQQVSNPKNVNQVEQTRYKREYRFNPENRLVEASHKLIGAVMRKLGIDY
jgi:hypothetical protein